MKVIATWDDHYRSLANLTIPYLREYCERYGYGVVTNNGEKVSTRHPAWWKFKLAMSELENSDWLCLVDVDWLIMDQTVPLYKFVDGLDADLVAGFDVNGLICGTTFVRNSCWSQKFLHTLWHDGKRFEQWPNREQTAMALLLYREPKAKWHVYPQSLFNSYPYHRYPDYDYVEGDYKSGDFAIHLPALRPEDRIEIFREYIKDISR